MRQRARLKDIADETGFSTNTVSLALHHSPLVAEETSKAIWAVAKRLNYRPNQLARSLVNRQSRTIGLVLTNIQNPILTRTAQSIHTALSQHRYATLFATSNHSLEEEKNAIEVFLGRQVDGMLIYPTSQSERDHIAEVIHHGTPVVLLAGSLPGIETVSFDAQGGARGATEHLIGLGHRRIGLVDNSAALGNSEKADGYMQALSEAGLPLDRDLMVDPGGFDAGHGYDAMPSMMSGAEKPTAILAANDMLAMGAIHWCVDKGIRVPEDLSVVGFDNIELAAHAAPPLTTVNYAADILSRRAVDRLLRLIEADEADWGEPRVESVEPELVVRRSSGPPPG